MKKKNLLLGSIGFLGFLALLFFVNGNPIYLSFVGFFAFFGHFFLGKIHRNTEDPQYISNKNTALSFAFKGLVLELFTFWCFAMILYSATAGVILMVVAYASSYNLYAIKFYHLERKQEVLEEQTVLE